MILDWDCTQLWTEIGEFDKKELDNSKDMKSTNWEARESARMEAYNRLFDKFLDEAGNRYVKPRSSLTR